MRFLTDVLLLHHHLLIHLALQLTPELPDITNAH
eukprot:COSAG06_NODE_10429_length_1683_cov_1.135101_2_plen_33_part_01